MKKLILFLLAVAASLILAQAQSGELKGVVTNHGEPIPFVNIAVYRGNMLLTGGVANFDGEYSIKPITPGIYNVEMSSLGYSKKRNEQVHIDSGKTTFLNESLVLAPEKIIGCFQEDNHSYRTVYYQRVAHGNAQIIARIKKYALRKGKFRKTKR